MASAVGEALEVGWSPEAALASPRATRTVGYVALIVGTLVVWQILHLVVGANLLTGPLDVASRAVDLWQSGQLQANVAISAQRLVLGWAIGCVVSVPLGLLMSQVSLVRRTVEPYLHFFRFIPPIAF